MAIPDGLKPVSYADSLLSEEANQESESQRRLSDDVLTPLRAHYLKKTLISLQFGDELSDLTRPSPHPSVSPFSYLGQPFSPLPKDAPHLDFPFIRYIFRQFVLTFPFLASAPKDFFPEKLQPFLASLLARNLSTVTPFDEDADKLEKATREKIVSKIQKQLALLLGSATRVVEPEEVVRLSQRDLERLETLARSRQAKELKLKDTFDVNIIGIRTIVDKGRVRSRVHEEFLVRTRRSHHPDVVVSRRYGDFRTLAVELRKAHPDSVVPSPPVKDRTAVTVSSTSPIASPSFESTHTESITSISTFGSGSSSGGFRPPVSPAIFSPTITPTTPIVPTTPLMPATPATPGTSAARLAREKNRLTLRGYLHTLLSSSTLASSPVLKSFLLSGPTRLTSSEVEDTRRREEADQVREEGRRRFARELSSRVDCLRDAAKSVKGDMMGKDGLRDIFSVIKVTSDVQELPPNFKAVLEWGRISLASTIFKHFFGADTASESLASLKRLHGLIPYFMLKGVLKISNPMAMIRGILDLFLAQPFGGRSLLQRMFTSNITEEVKALQEDILAVQDKVEDPVICEKIRLFVYAPEEIQAMFKDDAATEKFHILTVILRSSEEPTLSRAQMQRVLRAHRAHVEYVCHQESLVDSDDDDGPQNDDAWLFEDLTILGKLYSRLRDREQLMGLIFEGTTAELLKDIITIFYAPLAQVYKAASIADSLADLQNFVNDLIRTVEGAEEVSQQDPAHTVKVCIDLVQRHEQSFYNFVHKVHSKGAGLFDSLLRWVELFLTTIREGIGEPISLEYLLPHTGQERRDILSEIDAIALYHYRLKVAYESKVRKRFGHGNSSGKPDVDINIDQEDVAVQTLVDGLVRDFSFGDLVHGDAEDLVADYSESEESDTESEIETEAASEDGTESEGRQTLAMSPPTLNRSRNPMSARLVSEQIVRASLDHPPTKINEPTPARRRAVSLRSLKSPDPHAARSAAGLSPVPPVPPLPLYSTQRVPPPPPPRSALPLRSATVSSRPSTLRKTRTTEDLKKSTALHASTASSQRPPKKKSTPDIKPPELKLIPGVLPLFREVIRPLLQPRKL